MAILKMLRVCGGLILDLGKTFFQMIKGIYYISGLPQPPVSIFGGSKLKMDSEYIQKAHELAHMLAAENIPVLTGGGPGIMEAANCGAMHQGLSSTSSIGISVKGLMDGGKGFNCCASTQITMEHFFSRKWLLMRYSIGFVIFPGGFGTLDEFGEIMTLIQTKRFKKVPVILFGSHYWRPLVEWVENSAVAHNLITEDDSKLFTVMDEVGEVRNLIIEHCKIC